MRGLLEEDLGPPHPREGGRGGSPMWKVCGQR